RFDIDRSAVLANDRHANAQAQAGASAGTLGGVERIKQPRQRLGKNADAVVLYRERNVAADSPDAQLNAAALANFANGLLGIADQVQENLNKLIGIANYRRQVRLRLEIDLHIVAAQRVILQLQSALDQSADMQR